MVWQCRAVPVLRRGGIRKLLGVTAAAAGTGIAGFVIGIVPAGLVSGVMAWPSGGWRSSLTIAFASAGMGALAAAVMSHQSDLSSRDDPHTAAESGAGAAAQPYARNTQAVE